MPSKYPNAGPAGDALQAQVTPAPNANVPLATDSIMVRSVTVQPETGNSAPLKVGYGYDTPVFVATQAAPFVLPVIQGKFYDLAKVFIRTTNGADKANYFAAR